ncbi:MAG TPA: hypothetical protein VEW03_09040 [Longimicrobiaceae bacterium]|nr:hypothetical protein [Longimicrobiaceae bacterium]
MVACPKCGSSMAAGYLLSKGSSEVAVSDWVEGLPDKRWWGLNLKNRTRIPITALRCNRCGFLELYTARVG